METNRVLAEEVPAARDVAGFAEDTMLDEGRFDGADVDNCARCAKARHGKPASKTINGKNRPQKRDIGATAKRVEIMLGQGVPFPQYRPIRRRRGLSTLRPFVPGLVRSLRA
jgi:hypothetical protein